MAEEVKGEGTNRIPEREDGGHDVFDDVPFFSGREGENLQLFMRRFEIWMADMGFGGVLERDVVNQPIHIDESWTRAYDDPVRVYAMKNRKVLACIMLQLHDDVQHTIGYEYTGKGDARQVWRNLRDSPKYAHQIATPTSVRNAKKRARRSKRQAGGANTSQMTSDRESTGEVAAYPIGCIKDAEGKEHMVLLTEPDASYRSEDETASMASDRGGKGDVDTHPIGCIEDAEGKDRDMVLLDRDEQSTVREHGQVTLSDVVVGVSGTHGISDEAVSIGGMHEVIDVAVGGGTDEVSDVAVGIGGTHKISSEAVDVGSMHEISDVTVDIGGPGSRAIAAQNHTQVVRGTKRGAQWRRPIPPWVEEADFGTIAADLHSYLKARKHDGVIEEDVIEHSTPRPWTVEYENKNLNVLITLNKVFNVPMHDEDGKFSNAKAMWREIVKACTLEERTHAEATSKAMRNAKKRARRMKKEPNEDTPRSGGTAEVSDSSEEVMDFGGMHEVSDEASTKDTNEVGDETGGAPEVTHKIEDNVGGATEVTHKVEDEVGGSTEVTYKVEDKGGGSTEVTHKVEDEVGGATEVTHKVEDKDGGATEVICKIGDEVGGTVETQHAARDETGGTTGATHEVENDSVGIGDIVEVMHRIGGRGGSTEVTHVERDKAMGNLGTVEAH